MGTSMAFYNIMNTGFTPESLKRKMSEFAGVTPVVAYCDGARWLPFFEEVLCEGNNASDDDLQRLSKIFDAPVIAFSIFDSDALIVSYIDGEKHIYNYVKPNIDEFLEAFDVGQYSTGFPDFLSAFCDKEGHGKLRDIWQSEEYVFADDRMYDICVLLGISTLYNGNEMPEGYQSVSAE